MSVLARIAFRNLLEHKSKSLIIGTIISVGVIVLVVGNSLMNTASLGIRRGFIENYTGDIMISGLAEGEVSLFGVRSPGGIEDTPTLPNYGTIRSYLDDRADVKMVTSQITGYARVTFQDHPGDSFSILFGVEPESYRKMFENIRFIEGRDIVPGEEGIVMSVERVEDLNESINEETEKETGEKSEITIKSGDLIRLTSYGNAGIKIREVPLLGIFEFRHASEGLGIDLISYISIQTLRALSGLTIGYQGDFDLDDGETALLDAESFDDFFDEAFSVEEQGASAGLDESKLDSILGDTTKRDAALQIDTGSWNYLLAKADNPRNTERSIRSINAWFLDKGFQAQAGNWEFAAGPFAKTADVIRTVFNVAIIIVGIVALIIMMNTLVISVIERTSEIGTMRALGAQKVFIWKLLLFETFTITTLFGGVGILLSIAIIGILNLVGIPATNVFLRILFAGDALRPEVSIKSIASAVAIASGVGALAHIYPVSVALKIAPVRAIQTE